MLETPVNYAGAFLRINVQMSIVFCCVELPSVLCCVCAKADIYNRQEIGYFYLTSAHVLLRQIAAPPLNEKTVVTLFQKKITDGIDSICAHLPGPTAKLCKEEVDKMLPLAITFVTSVVVSCRRDHSSLEFTGLITSVKY